jgi:hypothetical protein
MSSLSVRTLVRSFLADNSDETIVDITGHFENLSDLLEASGVSPDAPWLALEFIGDSEEAVSLTADNQKGLYREFGLIQLHVCAVARIGVGSSLEARAEVLRSLFRGRRIGDIVINSVSPINTGPGATLEFENGWVSGTVSLGYQFDYSPGT